jgi:hypothetical protein
MWYFLLPYMEQEAVYERGVDAFNTNPGAGVWADSQYACDSKIPAFICPSDPTNSSNLADGNIVDYCTTSTPGLLFLPEQNTGVATQSRCATGLCYAANILAFDPNPDLEVLSSTSSARTGPAKGSLNEAMLDGTANTIAFAHRYKVCANSGGGPHNQWWGAPRNASGIKQTGVFGLGDYSRLQNAGWAGPRNPNPAQNLVITSGASFCSTSYSSNFGGGIPFQTTPRPCTCSQTVVQSPHPSAMMVGLGDGSARSISSSIATRVWYIACHPYDGESQSSGW